MDILRPRGTYQRAASSDPIHDTRSGSDNVEMSSSLTAVEDTTPKLQSGFSSTIQDAAPLLLDPSTDPIKPNESNNSGRRWKWPALKGFSRLYGWRTGALSAAFSAGTSFLINLVVLVWLATHPGNLGDGVVQLFNGSCTQVERMDLWIHLAINALSTLLLSGSNYCMQCLCAPTRKDVDAAHAKGIWLDIGVPSTRNLRRVPVYKTVMWVMLGLSSLPLHLIYNSAFYKSLSTNDYSYYIVNDDFLTNSTVKAAASVSQPTGEMDEVVDPAKIQADLKIHGRYERLENADCIRAYGTNYITDRRNLVLVSQNTTADHSNLFEAEFYFYTNYYPFDWICSRIGSDVAEKAQITFDDGESQWPCEKYLSRLEAIADEWNPYGYDVQYCLSEVVPETCSYSGNIPIVAVILAANLIKLIGMLYVAFRLRDTPLITVGDAVESFLDNSDRTTEGMCLLTKEDVVAAVRKGHRWDQNRVDTDAALASRGPDTQTTATETEAKPLPPPRPPPKTARLRKLRWSQSASGLRWSMTIGLILVALLVVTVLLGVATRAIESSGFTIAEVGIGKVTPSAIITGWNIGMKGSPGNRIISSILVANLPQTIFSFLYLNLNGLLTTMWLASEWSDFATKRKTLRVSKPKGLQRSTHFLHLPYKVAVPLMVLSGLLHWMISQALFLVVLAEYYSDGTLATPVAVASCGFSPLAMLMALVAGVVLVTAVSVLAFACHYDPHMPLAGSCSAAISAACHQPDWDADAAMKLVKWGVVPDRLVGREIVDDHSQEEHGQKDVVGHCCFTSGDAGPLQDGRQYAGSQTMSWSRKEGRPRTATLETKKAL